MDWTTALRVQQADFIERMKSGHLLHCEKEGQHSELTIISGERLKQLRSFCWEMAEKYKRTSQVRDVFINNLKGKLAEEVIKARLGNLVTEVDYEKRLGGDGKVDFTLTADSDIGIQVKARHGNIDTVRWSITAEEVEKNSVLVCILIQEEVSEAQSEYNLIMAGIIPTNMVRLINGKALVRMDKLLYSGGLKAYVEHFKSSIQNDFFSYIPEIKQKNNSILKVFQYISIDAIIKAFNYLKLGINQYKLENYEGAIQNFNKSIRLNPKIFEAYNWRSDTRNKLGNHQGAIEDANKALEIIIENAAKSYTYRGNAYFKIGDKTRSINDFNQAISIHPGFAEAYFFRGCLRIGEDNQAAIEDLTQAIRTYPDYSEAYLWLGLTRLAIGDKQGAIEDFTQLIIINPNNEEAYLARGGIRLQIRDKQGAIEDFTQAIKINSNNEIAHKILSSLLQEKVNKVEKQSP